MPRARMSALCTWASGRCCPKTRSAPLSHTGGLALRTAAAAAGPPSTSNSRSTTCACNLLNVTTNWPRRGPPTENSCRASTPDEQTEARAKLSDMPDDASGGFAPVTVIRDKRLRAAGRRLGDAVVYDWGFELDGGHYEQRSFVLLDDGFQINQPVIFPAAQQGWWYCDLVKFTDGGDIIRVDDLWIDVVVGPPDHPYRVLDLDEYADAAARGVLSAADMIDGLVRTQRFLDRHLNRRHDTDRTWPDFPPRSIGTLQRATFPADWSLINI
jgi:Protein of unknown function (DUF402)